MAIRGCGFLWIGSGRCSLAVDGTERIADVTKRSRWARFVSFPRLILLTGLLVMAMVVSAGAEVEDEGPPLSSVGIAPPSDRTSQQASSFLQLLKVGDVELSEEISTEFAESAFGLAEGQARYVVARFHEAVTDSLRDTSDVLGAVRLETLSSRAFLVAIPAESVAESVLVSRSKRTPSLMCEDCRHS